MWTHSAPAPSRSTRSQLHTTRSLRLPASTPADQLFAESLGRQNRPPRTRQQGERSLSGSTPERCTPAEGDAQSAGCAVRSSDAARRAVRPPQFDHAGPPPQRAGACTGGSRTRGVCPTPTKRVWWPVLGRLTASQTHTLRTGSQSRAGGTGERSEPGTSPPERSDPLTVRPEGVSGGRA